LVRALSPEVEHLHGSVRPQLDVGGFQISVDDALLVRGFESFGNLPRDGQRFVDVNRPLDQTGSPVVWARPFPGPGSPVRVSAEGGHQPAWSSNGRELFFQNWAEAL
jgi:hypothetical protein